MLFSQVRKDQVYSPKYIGSATTRYFSIQLKKKKLIITPYKPVFRTVSQNRPKRYVDALVDLKTDVIIAGKDSGVSVLYAA